MKLISSLEYLGRYPNFRLINRDNDIERITSILTRKKNNSLLLTGSRGVGVSSLIRGLLIKKQCKDVSFDILSKQFFILDVDGLFASGDGNEINKEFQQIIKSLTNTPNSVLIIFDAYNFIEGAQNSGNSHFINILNNADRSETFQVILEVNDDQLNSVYKWNNCINDLYTLYEVKELPEDKLFEVVNEVANTDLEQYHGIKISDEAVREAIRLTNKYRDDFGLGNSQPSKSIALLDRALSAYKQFVSKEHPSLTKLKQQLEEETNEDKKAQLQITYNASYNHWQTLMDDIAYISQLVSNDEALRIQYTSDLEKAREKQAENTESLDDKEIMSFASLTNSSGFETKEITKLKKDIKLIDEELANYKKRYKDLLSTLNDSLSLEREDVIKSFSIISGISSAKLDENEMLTLRNLEDNLKARIFGQDDAVKAVANGIKVARVDSLGESGPAACYLFLGPSGVGKTEMCKALAQNLYGDERALIRFDMSEYMEKHAVAKLIGAPPGYEGFECGGILTNTVRKNPIGIYLFDEIEKAHPDVFNIFLQILSDGRLTDNIGRTVDFSETIIIMTSNIGQTYYLDASISDEEAVEKANEELCRTYRSELLNRFNGRENILHFHRLSMDSIEKIVFRELNRMNDCYEPKGYHISIEPECVRAFCNDHYDVIRGARGLPGYIKANLRPIIVNHILEYPDDKGTFRLDYDTQSKTFNVEFIKG